MIPQKLTLKNFLCYRGDVPTLDLEGITVACLCGENGHGKSALLDAITYALWGDARGTRRRGRTQDELVHHGENEMLVDLEFDVQGTRYRVVRRHRRRQRGSGASDLQLMVRSGDGFRPITADSINQTQRHIEELVGLDYDTFINSAFLLQGRADEFTNKTPDRRKEVLARVMGLDAYDRLTEQARERASERQRDLVSVEALIQGLERDVGMQAEVQEALDQVQQALAKTQAGLEEAHQRHEASRQQVEELRRLQAEVRALQERLPTLEKERASLISQAQRHQQRIQGYEAVLADRQAIEAGYGQLQEARKRLEELSLAHRRSSALAQEREAILGLIRAEQARLSEQARQLEAHISGQLVPKAQSIPRLGQEIAELRIRMEALEGREAALALAREQLHEKSEQAGQLNADLERFKKEGQDLRTRLDLLEAQPAGTVRCPLCNSLLSDPEFRHLVDQHHGDIEEKRRLFLETKRRAEALSAEQSALQKEIAQLERALRKEQQAAQSRAGSLERELEDAQKAASELDEARKRLALLTAQLDKGEFAAQDKERLAELEREIASVAYDPAQHDQAQKTVGELQPFEERHRLLVEAEMRLPQEQDAQQTAEQMAVRIQQDIASSQARMQEIGARLKDLPQRESELRQAEAQVRALENEMRGLLGRQGELAGRLEVIRRQEQELHGLRRRRSTLAEEAEAFSELARAFGRTGIQAMLIESVIPELEQQANELLGRMTEGRMHLKLETQREARSGRGDPIETLDIHIADELGTRSYEMYSGGEAFRINLALRIALSRILAQRKGAPLPVLFIDEGFGTQDSAGRERIIEVIRAIEPLFEKILVITHMEEVKEAFPVRIEVHKQDGSSTFVIT